MPADLATAPPITISSGLWMAATAPYVPRHPVGQPFKNPPCHGVALERGGEEVFSLDSSGTKALAGQNDDDDIHPDRRTLPAIAQGRKVSVVGQQSRWPTKPSTRGVP